MILVGLPGGHTADVVADALADAITSLPSQLCCSITWDQGKEMAEHARFSAAAGMPSRDISDHSRRGIATSPPCVAIVAFLPPPSSPGRHLGCVQSG